MRYDKHAIISCDNCDATDYQLNYSEDSGVPEVCPFCKEQLEDIRIFDKDDFETLEEYLEEFGLIEDD